MTETTSTAISTASTDDVSIAVIGGSGLYRLFDEGTAASVDIMTPYGPTSAPITIGLRAGRRVAFLARHGGDHTVAPHLINYRANIWALASLGVKAIISSSAVGGVSPDYPPGMLVVTLGNIPIQRNANCVMLMPCGTIARKRSTASRPMSYGTPEKVSPLSNASPLRLKLR